MARSHWGFECLVTGPDCGSKGLTVLFKNNFEYIIHNILKNDKGRYVSIDTEMLKKSLTLANVYVQGTYAAPSCWWVLPCCGDPPSSLGRDALHLRRTSYQRMLSSPF